MKLSNTAAVSVDFSGPDCPMLLDRDGELLLALEHIAAKMLRLSSGQQTQVSFESCGHRATRLVQETEPVAMLPLHGSTGSYVA